jgi:predicted TIM-barrel fold metal-dependent hydrolase
MPVEVIPIYRIEPLIVELLKEDIGWSEFRQRYDDAIAHAIEHEGYRGLKSIIAYRTGLDISPLSRTPDQGLQALDAIQRGIGGQATKKLRDYLFCRTLELCMEYDVPMQVHTGMGDFEVNLVLCRPSLLMDLLRFPTFRGCRVLLVHGGYPYHAEAGYMANVLPRVYCDVSQGIPFAANAAHRIFAEMLEMAPLSKVVYGSDGFNLPEINYIGAKLGKTALAQALEDLVNGDMLSQGEAEEAAGLILAGNARRLYGLDG